MINPHLMLGNIAWAKRFFPPFHFYEIYISVNFNHPVNLLNNTFAIIAANCKGLANKNATFLEKAI